MLGSADLFGEDTMDQLGNPLNIMDDVKPSLVLPNHNNFEDIPAPNKNTQYNNITSNSKNVPNPWFSPIHSQPVSNNTAIPNMQVKNVLPVQNPTTVIISSSNIQHNSQPLVYTSLPMENQHILQQQSSGNVSSNSSKSTPVILQNIQQPVLLQAKLIKSDNKVGSGLFNNL